MDLLLALPSLIAEQEVLAPSQSNADKGENQAALPVSLERFCVGLHNIVFCALSRPSFEALARSLSAPLLEQQIIISCPKHLPYGNLMLQATI